MKNAIRKKAVYLTLCSLFFVACSLFIACPGPASGIGDSGTAAISISLGAEAGRAAAGFNDAVDSADLGYVVKLINCDTNKTEEIPVNPATNTASKSRVVPGTYRITVDALIWGWPYASGTHPPFTVEAGKSYTAPIKMQRLPDAVILKNVKQGETVSFPSVARTGPATSKVIEIYNFTGNSSLNVTAALTNGTGYNLSSSSFSINQDGKATLTLTTVTNTSNIFPDTLTISSGGISRNVDLSFIVTPLNGDISTAAELAAVAGNLGGTYRLMNNITLSGNWTPIGTSAEPFTGSFDGMGYTISNLTINSSSSYQGLFGYIGSGGVVKNLGLINVNISSSGDQVGGIAGYNYGTVEKCYTIGGSIAAHGYVGGIVGLNGGTSSPGTIQQCYNTASISATYSFTGGIAGDNNYGSITNCYNTGNVTGGNRVGGIAGFVYKFNTDPHTVAYCYSTGDVTGIGNSSEAAGGIAGGSSDGLIYQTSTFHNNIALGRSVSSPYSSTGNLNVGRVGGWIRGENNKARDDMTVIRASATLTVSGTSASIGAVDTSINGADITVGGTTLANVFSGWDTTIWSIPNSTLTVNGSLPTLIGVGTSGTQNPKLP
jgi:hypothetical protein